MEALNKNVHPIHLIFNGRKGPSTELSGKKLYLIRWACDFLGLGISEFCRMAAVKEARKVLLNNREDKIEFAKKVLLEEEEKKKEKESQEQ